MLNRRTFRRCQKQTITHMWKQIFQHCKDRGLSIEELGYYHNISFRLLQNWSEGKGYLSYDVLMGVARALDAKVVITLEKLKPEEFLQ